MTATPNFFIVEYRIPVEASDFESAAREAQRLCLDSACEIRVWDVVNTEGERVRIYMRSNGTVSAREDLAD